MHGAVIVASMAASISMGTALLAGCFSIWIAMRSRSGKALQPDITVSVLVGAAMLLMVLDLAAAGLIAANGMSYVGPIKAALLLTAMFAVAGMAAGLMRGLRSGKASKGQST